MLETFLVPEVTQEKAGEGQAIPLGVDSGKNYLLTLAITNIIEQQSLDVGICGSADGADWGAKPVTTFPQKFYQGLSQIFMDLSDKPDIKFLKVKWAMKRWGVGSQTPRFSFMVKIQEKAMAGAAR